MLAAHGKEMLFLPNSTGDLRMTTRAKRATKIGAALIFIGIMTGCASQAMEDRLGAAEAAAAAAASDAAAANSAATSAQSAASAAQKAASAAQSTADQAMRAANQAQSCCDATNAKIDRMFQKSMSK